jgi:hypothetical protein
MKLSYKIVRKLPSSGMYFSLDKSRWCFAESLEDYLGSPVDNRNLNAINNKLLMLNDSEFLLIDKK